MAQAQTTRPELPGQPEQRRVTLEEYLELLDTEGFEIIDGELIPMSPESLSSNDVAHTLYDSLHPFVEQHQLGRVRMEAAFALDVDSGTRWVKGSLVPDVAFISTEKVREQKAKYPTDNVYRIPPDLAVEVVSPTDPYSMVERKVKRYLDYGVPLVWVIDPQNLFVRIHTPQQNEKRILTENDTLTGDLLLSGWSMTLKELFAVL